MMTLDMLAFVKALSQTDRLKIIGALARQPASAVDIASQLNFRLGDAVEQLNTLERVGLVQRKDEIYHLDVAGLEALVKSQFATDEARKFNPAADLDEDARKVLANFLNPDGTLRQIPLQLGKLRVILNYLVQSFEVGAVYTEKEVNSILRRFHLDTAGLRRDLIDHGLMAREGDGSRYWRVE